MSKILSCLTVFLQVTVTVFSTLLFADPHQGAILRQSDPRACLIENYDHSGFVMGFSLDDFHPTYNTSSMPTLSPFWAQEYSGLDIVASELENQKRDIPVAIYDEGFDFSQFPSGTYMGNQKIIGQTLDHGTAVASLIAGKSPLGSPVAYISEAQVFNSKATKPKNPVSLINISMGANPYVAELLRELSESAILVTSAGNDYFRPVDSELSQLNAIRVGSLSTYGLMSDFSQLDDSVDILAPSSTYLQARRPNGTYQGFGGTSGASPMVVAALASALHVNPLLDTDLFKILLKKTGTPTIGSPHTPNVLNAVRLLEASKLLRTLCETKDCMTLLLHPQGPEGERSLETILNFESLANKTEQEAKALLTGNCDSIKQGFKLLRKAFLLNPTAARRYQIVKRYDSINMGNALFYEATREGASLSDLNLHKMYSLNTPSSMVHIERALLRSELLTKSNPIEHLRRALKSESLDKQIASIELIGKYPGQHQTFFTEALSETENTDRKIATLNQLHTQGDWANELIQAAMKADLPKSIRITAYRSAVLRNGFDATPFVLEAMNDKEYRIQQFGIQLAGYLLATAEHDIKIGRNNRKYIEQIGSSLLTLSSLEEKQTAELAHDTYTRHHDIIKSSPPPKKIRSRSPIF